MKTKKANALATGCSHAPHESSSVSPGSDRDWRCSQEPSLQTGLLRTQFRWAAFQQNGQMLAQGRRSAKAGTLMLSRSMGVAVSMGAFVLPIGCGGRSNLDASNVVPGSSAGGASSSIPLSSGLGGATAAGATFRQHTLGGASTVGGGSVGGNRTTVAHAGAAGFSFSGGGTAGASAMLCAAPLAACGEAALCVDTRWDPSHCGACDHACGLLEHCASGVCVASCGAEQMSCPSASGGSSCVSAASDVLHCGACDKQCPAGATCERGDCLCAGGPCCEAPLTACGANGASACVDTGTNAAHCGACNVACAAGEVCVQGRCSGCSPHQFWLPVAYPTGALKGAPASAPTVEDLNADGKLDVLMPNTGGASLSYFLGDGQGRLIEQPRLDIPGAPLVVRVADFDRDGHKDIITLVPGAVLVRWGSPDHEFTKVRNYAVLDVSTIGQLGMELVDVVGDEALDIVVLNNASTGLTVSALRGGAQLTGDKSLIYEDTKSRSQLRFQAADLNGDGLLDVALLGNGMDGLISNDDWGLEYRPNLIDVSSYEWWGLSVLELNGDASVDVAGIMSDSSSYGPHWLRPALGNAQGGFALVEGTSEAGTGAYTPNFVFGDLDGDGLQDALSRLDSANYVSFHRGSGSGVFETTTSSQIAAGYAGMAVAELTGDGVLDLVVAHDAASALTLHRGKGDGSFESYMLKVPDKTYLHNAALLPSQNGAPPQIVTVGGLDEGRLRVFSLGASGELTMTDDVLVYRPETVTLSDLDADGQLDALVPAERSLYWLRNEGGHFGAPAVISGEYCGYRAFAADLDGDGQKEVVAATPNGKELQVFKRDRNTDTWSESNFPLAGISAFAVGDVNADQLDDVFATTSDGASSDPVETLSIWLGSRTKLLEHRTTVPLPADGRSLRVADWDGDGYNDVFVATYSGYVTLRGNADAEMVITASGTDRVNFQGSYEGPDGLLVDDVDRDGKLDLLATMEGDDGRWSKKAGVALWRGLGDGHFQRTESYLVPGANSAVGLFDFDGDGIRDLLLSGGSAYGGSLMLMKGAVRCE